MINLTVRVTTRYTSHPISGAGRIRATAMGGGRATRHRPYNHGESVDLNHMNASWEAFVALMNKLGVNVADPSVQVTRALTREGGGASLPGDGRREYTYTVKAA